MAQLLPGTTTQRDRTMSIRITVALIAAAFAMSVALVEAQPQPRPGQPKGGGGGSPAQSGDVITSTTPDLTARMLRDAGYSDVKTVQSKDGKTHVIGNVHDTSVAVMHVYDDQNRAYILDCLVYFGKQDKIDKEYANAWNKKHRFTQAYIDDDGDLNLMMNVELAGGVTSQFIKHSAQRYAAMLKLLYEFKNE